MTSAQKMAQDMSYTPYTGSNGSDIENPGRRKAMALIGTAALSPIAMANDSGNSLADPHMSNSISVPRTALPSRPCDCHVHIFDPVRFPYAPKRTYTPGAATVDDLLRFEQILGMERVVLVQPSVYGTDNRCLVDALGKIGTQKARGIAVVDLISVSDDELDHLHSAGIRGVRLNLEVKSDSRADTAAELLHVAERRLAARNWSVQLYADLPLVLRLAETLKNLKIRVMLDHFAGAKAGTDTPATYEKLAALTQAGNVFVKLSALYRVSKQAPGYNDVQAIAQALIRNEAAGLVWGSDWPHTGSSGNRSGDLSIIESFRKENDGSTLDALSRWIPDEGLRKKIFVDNPGIFYDF